MSFWSAIFGGQNKTLNNNIKQFGDIGGFATGLGKSSTSQGIKFLSDIVSGDSTKISRALGPEIGAIQKRTQQQKNEASQFGNRSGGNNAVMQAAGDTARSEVTNLEGGLLGGAVSGLVSSGESLLDKGMAAYDKQTELSQMQVDNWRNSILGKGLSFGTGFLEGRGLSNLFSSKK